MVVVWVCCISGKIRDIKFEIYTCHKIPLPTYVPHKMSGDGVALAEKKQLDENCSCGVG